MFLWHQTSGIQKAACACLAWSGEREGIFSPWPVGLAWGISEPGLSSRYCPCGSLWSQMLNNYLRGRQICLDKICCLYEVRLLLPTLDILVGQESGLFKLMYIERTSQISLRKLRPEKLNLPRKLAGKDLEFSSLPPPSPLNFPLHSFALLNFWKCDSRSKNWVMFMWFTECNFLETRFVTFKNQSVNRPSVISNTCWIIRPISVVSLFPLDLMRSCIGLLSLWFSVSMDSRIR